MTARVSMLLKSRASLTCFRASFLPGRAKELSAPLYAFVFRCGRRMCSVNAMEHDLLGPVYRCSLSGFVPVAGRWLNVLNMSNSDVSCGASNPPQLCWISVTSTKCLFPGTVLTYVITPWCRVLLEKLTGLQLVKKFPSFHGTRRFITALTSVRHLSLS